MCFTAFVSHLGYYDYQATARGVAGRADIEQIAADKAFIWSRIVLPWLPIDRQARICELACGHGSFLYWLSTQGYRDICGVDAAAQQVKLARLLGVTVVEEDALDWLNQQPDSYFDGLIGIDFIEHISKDAMMHLLKVAQAKLRPKGRLILRYPNGDSPLVGLNLFNDITHVWTYTTNCLNTLAMMHGFARTDFADEGWRAMRDHRWLKLPFAIASEKLLRLFFQAVSREKLRYWSSSIWACLQKGD